MRGLGRIGVLSVLGAALAVGAAGADEEKVPLDKVPKKVLDAFKAKFPDATIKNATKEEEDNETVYEIESTRNGLGLDCALKPNGEIVEIEQEIRIGDLPAKAAAAIEAKHPKGKVTKAEEITKGKTFYYEAVVRTAEGKDAEVSVDKDGKILD
jgi:hypothetical protein